MTPPTTRKRFFINTGILLGVAALFFRGYLPLTEEIASQNEQLKTVARQLDTLKREAPSTPQGEPSGQMQIYAVPEPEIEHFSQELETLAQKYQMKLIHIEPDPDHRETFSKLKVSLIPYNLGFSGKDPRQFAALLADLETSFPEVSVQSFHYQKEVASLEAQVLTSSQSVRLFSP
jgi:hypothetical protein